MNQYLIFGSPAGAFTDVQMDQTKIRNNWRQEMALRGITDPQVLRGASVTCSGETNNRRFNGRHVRAKNVTVLLEQAQKMRKNGEDRIWPRLKDACKHVAGDTLRSLRDAGPRVFLGGLAAKAVDKMLSSATSLPFVGEFAGDFFLKTLVGESAKVYALANAGDGVMALGSDVADIMKGYPTTAQQQEAMKQLVIYAAENQKTFNDIACASFGISCQGKTVSGESLAQAIQNGEQIFLAACSESKVRADSDDLTDQNLRGNQGGDSIPAAPSRLNTTN